MNKAELHDINGQDGGSWGMPVEEYTDKSFQGFKAGQQEIPVGSAVDWYKTVEIPRRKAFMKHMGADKGDYV
jgi:hypothetical protein